MRWPDLPDVSRRRALKQCLAAAAAGVGLAGGGLAGAGCTRPRSEAGSRPSAPGDGSDAALRAASPADESRGEDALDEALRRLHAAEPRIRLGLSTHSPMVVEALSALGRADRIAPWLDAYRATFREIPVPSRPIARDAWREALGPRQGAPSWEAALWRWGDWKELFITELAGARWQDVLDTWVARLAPGYCAAAMHGIIRTGHAARALSRREGPARLAELARGLAYWAAAYQELPARPAATGARAATYAEALERLPLHSELRGGMPGGNIVNGIHEAASLEGFAAARDLAPLQEDTGAALSALTATFARAYLRHGAKRDRIAAVGLVHAVTGPCALRRIAPHVKPETARAALPYAWQAAAGIYCAYARRDNPPPAIEPRSARDAIVERALENASEHAIKLTEALLSEHAIRPQPVYLAAAEEAAPRL